MFRFDSDMDHRLYFQGPSEHISLAAHLTPASWDAFVCAMRAGRDRLAASLPPHPILVDRDPGDENDWPRVDRLEPRVWPRHSQWGELL